MKLFYKKIIITTVLFYLLIGLSVNSFWFGDLLILLDNTSIRKIIYSPDGKWQILERNAFPGPFIFGPNTIMISFRLNNKWIPFERIISKITIYDDGGMGVCHDKWDVSNPNDATLFLTCEGDEQAAKTYIIRFLRYRFPFLQIENEN